MLEYPPAISLFWIRKIEFLVPVNRVAARLAKAMPTPSDLRPLICGSNMLLLRNLTVEAVLDAEISDYLRTNLILP